MPQLLVTVDGALFYVLFLSLEEDRPCFGIFSITIALCGKGNTYRRGVFFYFFKQGRSLSRHIKGDHQERSSD